MRCLCHSTNCAIPQFSLPTVGGPLISTAVPILLERHPSLIGLQRIIYVTYLQPLDRGARLDRTLFNDVLDCVDNGDKLCQKCRDHPDGLIGLFGGAPIWDRNVVNSETPSSSSSDDPDAAIRESRPPTSPASRNSQGQLLTPDPTPSKPNRGFILTERGGEIERGFEYIEDADKDEDESNDENDDKLVSGVDSTSQFNYAGEPAPTQRIRIPMTIPTKRKRNARGGVGNS